MTSSSSNDATNSPSLIRLNTYDETKILAFTPEPGTEYNDDLHFVIEVAGDTIRGTEHFQISIKNLKDFIENMNATLEGEIHDENGDGSIQFSKIDSIGHTRVITRIGGPWSDQAIITFDTDQTAISSLVQDFSRLFAAPER